jgi:hypothetical protein
MMWSFFDYANIAKDQLYSLRSLINDNKIIRYSQVQMTCKQT